MRNIFVTATRENQGKTVITLGLMDVLSKRVGKIGFIKPVGQRDVEIKNYALDEDTLLVEKVCNVHCSLQDMSPVTLKGGFPESIVEDGRSKELFEGIRAAFDRIAKDKELVVIEGSGHAAIGSVFGLSNAAIAKMCNARVLLISSGGVGHPVDEIMLNKCYFDAHGVELLGVAINKVYPEEMEKVQTYTKGILENRGVRFLGAIPYVPELYTPTMLQIAEHLRGDVICGEHALANRIGRVFVGAMTPRNALTYLSGDILPVLPGDRDDLILTFVSVLSMPPPRKFNLTGLVLTGNLYPPNHVLEVIRRLKIPVIVARGDTYSVASAIYSLNVKISPRDREKISLLLDVVKQHLDFDIILELVRC